MALKDLVGMIDRSETSVESKVEATAKTAIPGTRTVAPATSIDADTQLSGKLRCKETIRVDGSVKGEIRCDKTVIVGEAAMIEAAIWSDSVVISGEVNGDITAKRKITLERTARVTGDLSTRGIVIEEGAMLTGRIVIGVEDQPVAKKQPTASRRESAPACLPAASQESAPATP